MQMNAYYANIAKVALPVPSVGCLQVFIKLLI